MASTISSSTILVELSIRSSKQSTILFISSIRLVVSFNCPILLDSKCCFNTKRISCRYPSICCILLASSVFIVCRYSKSLLSTSAKCPMLCKFIIDCLFVVDSLPFTSE
eukprot:NODE_49_length_27162_cov_0.380039.p15 type:complete len:109 gc:universal NODE_49_length_27162_cov_0.380039:17813-18139(+)